MLICVTTSAGVIIMLFHNTIDLCEILDLHGGEDLSPGNRPFRNVGTLPQRYMASQPRRPRFELTLSSPWRWSQ